MNEQQLAQWVNDVADDTRLLSAEEIRPVLEAAVKELLREVMPESNDRRALYIQQNPVWGN